MGVFEAMETKEIPPLATDQEQQTDLNKHRAYPECNDTLNLSSPSLSLQGILCRANAVKSRLEPHGAAGIFVATESSHLPFSREFGIIVNKVQAFKEAIIEFELNTTASQEAQNIADKKLRKLRRSLLRNDLPLLRKLANGRHRLTVRTDPLEREVQEQRIDMVVELRAWIDEKVCLENFRDECGEELAVDITVDACASCDDERSMHSVERLIGDEPGKRQGSCCETKPNNSHPEVFGVYTEVSPSRQGQHLPVTSPADTIVQDSATMPSEREGVSQDMATSQYVDLSTDLNQQQKSAVRFSVRSLGPESSTLGLSTAPTLRAPYPTGVAAELKYIQDLAAGTSRKTAETQHPVEGIESFNASHSKSEKEQSSIDSAIALEAAQRRDALLSTVRESQRMRNQLKIKHEAKQRQQAAKWDDSTFFSPEVLHCVEKLRSLQGEPDSLLKMIYADYPPKDGRCIYACGNFKKTVQRAISHYHPDKQDDELHGHDWVNICDEICKELTRLYTKL